MNSTKHDRIIALAGMFQAGQLIRQISQDGTADSEPFAASLHSILNVDAATTEAVYGGLQGVTLGLSLLKTLFGSTDKQRDLEVARYVFGIIQLDKKLNKNLKMLDTISIGIERAIAQTQRYELPHENVIANLAGIYTETISLLSPKIMVSGAQNHLTNPKNADKVRTLLLALMRSAVLWRQKGGRRWQIIFGRGRIMQEANTLLLTIDN